MSAERRLWVYGAGGHGRVVADAAATAGFEVAGFIDDAVNSPGRTVSGKPVRTLEQVCASESAPVQVALGVGDNAARERVFRRIREKQTIGMPAIVHARAVVSASAHLADGVVVLALAVVNPDAKIGEGAIINSAAVVEHDARIGSFAHLSPNVGLGGSVSIGVRSHVGVGACIIPGIQIGDDVRVGAGAVVIRDVASGETVAGVPARPLPKKAPR